MRSGFNCGWVVFWVCGGGLMLGFLFVLVGLFLVVVLFFGVVSGFLGGEWWGGLCCLLVLVCVVGWLVRGVGVLLGWF